VEFALSHALSSSRNLGALHTSAHTDTQTHTHTHSHTHTHTQVPAGAAPSAIVSVIADTRPKVATARGRSRVRRCGGEEEDSVLPYRRRDSALLEVYY
jgi:hypothetical protein